MCNALGVHPTQSQVDTKRRRNTQSLEQIRKNGNQPKPTADIPCLLAAQSRGVPEAYTCKTEARPLLTAVRLAAKIDLRHCTCADSMSISKVCCESCPSAQMPTMVSHQLQTSVYAVACSGATRLYTSGRARCVQPGKCPHTGRWCAVDEATAHHVMEKQIVARHGHKCCMLCFAPCLQASAACGGLAKGRWCRWGACGCTGCSCCCRCATAPVHLPPL